MLINNIKRIFNGNNIKNNKNKWRRKEDNN
jgi:hypothetical protein